MVFHWHLKDQYGFIFKSGFPKFIYWFETMVAMKGHIV